MFSQPAIGKEFFGRQEVLDILAKRVSALKSGYRQNVALTGQMLAGKSSILHHFIHSLTDASIIPIYVEMVDEPFGSFADKFIATLLYNYLKSDSRPLRKDLDFLFSACCPLVPRTVKAAKEIKSLLSKKRRTMAYRSLLDLTSIFKDETGRSCVVILDEFHNLEKFGIKNPYLYFGKIIMVQKNTMYIVSSSQKSAIKKILSEKLALLFGNFEILEITGFDAKIAFAFLDEKLSPFTARPEYKEYIVNFTDGNPFYMDAICKKIKELTQGSGQGEAAPTSIVEALASLVFNSSGTIHQYLSNQLNFILEKREGAYLEILFALSMGRAKIKDIKARLRGRRGNVSLKLDRLLKMDIVHKCGSFYRILDRVMEFWLRHVFYRKRTNLIDNVIDSAEDFKKSVLEDISLFLSERAKPPSQRLADLLHEFGEDLVEIDKKLRRLPSFVKVELEKYEGGCEIVSHKSGDKYWLFRIKENKVDENDIMDFVDEPLSLKERPLQRVVVALKGASDNAILVAKEKRIWLWSPTDLNRLFRIYGKYSLII